MHEKFTAIIIDYSDLYRYDVSQVTSTFAMKGMACFSQVNDRSTNLGYLANDKLNENAVYLAANAESITAIAQINADLRGKETPGHKMKEVAVLWCGNKDEKPVVEGLPIVALERFNKAKPILDWKGFKALAEEKKEVSLRQRLWKTFMWGKTTNALV